MWVGVTIGIVAGLGAIVFAWAIDAATHLLLGGIAGYTPPAPAGEGGTAEMGPERLWLIPVVVTLGGLVSGVIVYSCSPRKRRVTVRTPRLIRSTIGPVACGSGPYR